ncbi:protease [Tepiditoga spiralis]|uniref:Protease n=1 Tax=Tepiditoga spiralis TaxID=2108365 RepID=A0A7G1GAH0_9BACT|nr:CPBP family intramembrane glutamic endopeptidase [Tepiditoga spiralis]BBE31132.1 protease [Tepiditoga spiralis]
MNIKAFFKKDYSLFLITLLYLVIMGLSRNLEIIFINNYVFYFFYYMFFVCIYLFRKNIKEKNIFLKPKLNKKYRILTYVFGAFIGFFILKLNNYLQCTFLQNSFFFEQNELMKHFSNFGLTFVHIQVKSNVFSETTLQRVLFLVIIAPIYEELIYRGIIFGFLKKKNIFLAFILSTLLFVSWHNFDTIAVFFNLFLAGFIYSLAYYFSGDLILSMVFHASYNLFCLLPSIMENIIK